MIAAKIENLSKAYEMFARPSDRLKELFFLGKRRFHQDFWALRDINFTIPLGSTIGIIGDNGAGKSTLLKILTGITPPTYGSFSVMGKVSAILELGTGFHPDFTGSENIYLTASLMGIGREELEVRHREIVDFAELGKFIDRPVRTYSSGMYMRLGFSIAVSLDPDLLIIDEVLAVGDQYFQKKCYDRMARFQEAGKTILFCSHDLYRVRQICGRTIWLDKGKIMADGDSLEVTEKYFDSHRNEQSPSPAEVEKEGEVKKPDWPSIASVRILDGEGREKQSFLTGEIVSIETIFRIPDHFDDEPSLGILVCRNDGVAVYGIGTEQEGIKPRFIDNNHRQFVLSLPELQVLSGTYLISVFLLDRQGVHIYERRDKAYSFSMSHGTKEVGIYRIPHRWMGG